MKKRFLSLIIICLWAASLLSVAVLADAPFTLTFDANGGYFELEGRPTVQTGETDPEGRSGWLPVDPRRDGYIFDGWRTEQNGGDSLWDVQFTGDAAVYASWNKIQDVATCEEFAAYYSDVPDTDHPAVRLTADMTVQDVCRKMGYILVPSGVTLTVGNGGYVEGDVDIEGAVLVKEGGTLATTMGSDVTNRGVLRVEEGGLLVSQMGGAVCNEAGGDLILEGSFICGSVIYTQGETVNRDLWFRNSGNVSGSGYVMVAPSETFDIKERPEDRVDMTHRMRANLGNVSSLTVFTVAHTFEELQTLYADEQVENVLLTVAEGDPNFIIHLNENFTVDRKKLCILDADLVIDSGSVLTVTDYDALLFGSHDSRIVVEAAGAAGPDCLAGGTLVIEDTKLFSGSDPEAIFTPTEDILFLCASMVETRYPAPAKTVYMHRSGTAKGHMPPDLTENNRLDVITDGTLTFTGDFSTRYLEVREGLRMENGARVSVRYLMYCRSSAANDLKGTEHTEYECAADLNAGYGMGDLVRLIPAENGRIYLPDESQLPDRPGFSFAGVDLVSPWQGSAYWNGTLQAELEAISVRTDSNGSYVEQPGNFPLILVFNWDLLPGRHIIRFDPTGGEVGPAFAATDEEGGVELPAANRPDYVFIGWSTRPDGEPQWEFRFTEDATLYAVWTPIVQVFRAEDLRRCYDESGGAVSPAVRIMEDMTVDFPCRNMGWIFIDNGVTLTIAENGCVEGDVEVGPEGGILVCAGGTLATTMGGDIVNRGRIAVEEQGVLVSQMGGRVLNDHSGVLLLNGTFECGCMGDGIWFGNDGSVQGSGRILLVKNGNITVGEERLIEDLRSILKDAQDITIGFGLQGTPGDADGDGEITSTDARLALQLSVGKISAEAVTNAAVLDVDGDGKITSTDARLILQYSVGKISEFPVVAAEKSEAPRSRSTAQTAAIPDKKQVI